MGPYARTKRRLAEKMGMRKATPYPDSFLALCKTMEEAERGSRDIEAALSRNFQIRGGQLEAVAECLRKTGKPELESGNWDRVSYGRAFVMVAEVLTAIATVGEQTSNLLLGKIPPVFANFHAEAYEPYKKRLSSLEARRLDMEQARDQLEVLRETKPNDEHARSAMEARVLETTVLHDKAYESFYSLISMETQPQYPLQIQAMHDCLLHLKAARVNMLKAIESPPSGNLPKITESQPPWVAPGPAPSQQQANQTTTPANGSPKSASATFSIADLTPLIQSVRGEVVGEKSVAVSQVSIAGITPLIRNDGGGAGEKSEPGSQISIADLTPLIRSVRGEVAEKSVAPSQITKSVAPEDVDKTMGLTLTLDGTNPPPPPKSLMSARTTKSFGPSTMTDKALMGKPPVPKPPTLKGPAAKAPSGKALAGKAKAGKASTSKAQTGKQQRNRKPSPISKPPAKSNPKKQPSDSKNKKKKKK